MIAADLMCGLKLANLFLPMRGSFVIRKQLEGHVQVRERRKRLGEKQRSWTVGVAHSHFAVSW